MDRVKIFANHFIMLAELVGLWSMLDMGVHIKRKTVRTMNSQFFICTGMKMM